MEIDIPLALKTRLLREAEELISSLPTKDPAIGDAILVEFPKEFREHNGISRFGRMVNKDGETRYHVAPMKLDRTSYYDFQSCDVMDFVASWDKGGRIHAPVDKLLRGAPYPTLKQSEEIACVNYQVYEETLISTLVDQGPLTLVNPSFKTMASAVRAAKKRTESHVFVMITSVTDHDWVADVRNFCRNSNQEGAPYLKYIRPYSVVGMSYLGTNAPIWYPPTDWVRLILSPAVDPSGMFRNFSVQYRPDGVFSRYEKKPGYEVGSYISRDTDKYVWNPETVDYSLRIPGAPGLYFIESTLPLAMKPQDKRKIFHSPWMITMKGTWQHIDWDYPLARVSNKVIYDVKEAGDCATYLSRRMRYPAPQGYTWAALEKYGTHWVTYASLKPHRDYNLRREVTADRDVLCLGEVKVQKVEKVIAPPSMSFVPKGQGQWPLLSDDFDLGSRDQVGHAYAYMTAQGRIISASRRTETGISFSPGGRGQDLVPFLPKGVLTNVPVFDTEIGPIIPIGALPYGQSFVCAGAKMLASLAPTMSLFETTWRTTQSLITGVRDPDFGGQVSTDSNMQALTEMMDFDVKHSDDYGLTTMQMSRTVGLNHHNLFYLLRKSSRFLLWKPGDVITGQFVNGRRILIPFLGDIKEGMVDGRMWSDILGQVEEGQSKFYSTNPFPLSFISLLRLNLCLVKRSFEEGSYCLQVKKMFQHKIDLYLESDKEEDIPVGSDDW